MTKEGKTFFEVFSQSASGTSGKETKGSGGGRPEEDLLVISDVSASSKPRRGWRGPYKVGLETVVLGAVGGVLLAVGCFFLGHKLGNKDLARGKSAAEKIAYTEKASSKPLSPIAKVSREKPHEVSTEKVPLAPKTVPSKDTWSLRVVSYKEGANGLEKATGLANVLKERTGHNAFVAKQGSQVVVCIGEFNSRDNTQLMELQKQVKEFKYEGKVQFAGCYPVRVK